MSKNHSVDLQELMDFLEIQPDESITVYNRKTKKFYTILQECIDFLEDENSIEEQTEWYQVALHEAKDFLENGDDYISVPSKFDIDEWSIMQNFCFSLEPNEIQQKLLRCIKQKGAFRKFKDELSEFCLEDRWYKFRNEKFRQIAIDWCEDNNLSYS